MTALVNRAYRTLKDPVARGLYWLEIHGESLGRDNERVPPALAARVFEDCLSLGPAPAAERFLRFASERLAQGARAWDGVWELTAKCLRPLPDKHRGLHDPEARVRLRHVDLITNPAARSMLRVRCRSASRGWSCRRCRSSRG